MAIAKEVKDTIKATAAETAAKTTEEIFRKMNRISWIDRQKAMTTAAFQNTERLLYCFKALEEHVQDEKAYIEMAFKEKSGSIVKYSKNKAQVNEDQIIKDRLDSYHRSKSDLERVQKALNKIKKRKAYAIIEMRYLDRKDWSENKAYTYEEIADELRGKPGFSEDLSDRTVRRQKDKLIKELAVLIFGSDAI